MPLRISPSLASAPMQHLAEVIRELETSGVDFIHFDIEDGSFVPVMTLGTRLIAELRPLTRLPFDVHLMMNNPEWLIPQLAQDGANRVSVHYEACPYPRRVLRMIVEHGMQAGLAFNPATPLPPNLGYLLPYLSFVTILSTEPEQPDAPLLADMLQKLQSGKTLAGMDQVEWVIDGGIRQETVRAARDAGADTLVIGRAVFQHQQISANLQRLYAELSLE